MWSHLNDISRCIFEHISYIFRQHNPSSALFLNKNSPIHRFFEVQSSNAPSIYTSGKTDRWGEVSINLGIPWSPDGWWIMETSHENRDDNYKVVTPVPERVQLVQISTITHVWVDEWGWNIELVLGIINQRGQNWGGHHLVGVPPFVETSILIHIHLTIHSHRRFAHPDAGGTVL